MNVQWISLVALVAIRALREEQSQLGLIQCGIQGRCNPEGPGQRDVLAEGIMGATPNLVGTYSPPTDGPGLGQTISQAAPVVARTLLAAAAAPVGPAQFIAAAQELLTPPGTGGGMHAAVECGLKGKCDPAGPGRRASLAQGAAEILQYSPYPRALAQAAAFVVPLNFPAVPMTEKGIKIGMDNYDIRLPNGMVANLGGKAGQVKIFSGRDIPVPGAWICADFPDCFRVHNPFPSAPKVLSGVNAAEFALRRAYMKGGRAYVEGFMTLPGGVFFGKKYEGLKLPTTQKLPALGPFELLGAIARGIWDLTRRRFPGFFKGRPSGP